MQAKDKDKKNFKRFSKRIFSLPGIRRGKRVVDYGENALAKELAGREQPGSPLNESSKDFANLLKVDLEATVSLDKLNSYENASEHVAETETLLQSPNKSTLQTTQPRLNRHSLQNPSSPGLQDPRLELGDFMNTSRDSGIDCSALNSEKNSPEQFVAFTRREAERIRQEHLQYMNGSILETLNETERSSNDESESENVQEVTGGEQDLDITVVCKNTIEEPCDMHEGHITPKKNSIEELSKESVNQEEIKVSRENTNYDSNVDENSCERTLLNSSCDLDSSSVEQQNAVNCSETFKETNSTGTTSSIDSPNTHLATPITQNSSWVETTSMENFLLNSNENKTDERKSAEAQLQQGADSLSLDLDCPHLIVSPLPVRSPVVANHKAIPQTPSPTSLYINENSAFARCKSLKRSVSDVGKGILGKLRHKKKDSASAKSKDDSYSVGEKYESKKFMTGRSKKLSKKKQSQKSEDKTNMNDSVLIVDLESNDRLGRLDGYCSDTHVYSREKSPVTKEILYHTPNPVARGSTDTIVRKKSPVVKEILKGFDKERLSQSLVSNSNNTETIEDFTNSIAEMTSRLCGSGRNSAESIECICGCKNRLSDHEGCDRRKTPSPQELNKHTDSLFGKCIEITDDSHGDSVSTAETHPGVDVQTLNNDKIEMVSDYKKEVRLKENVGQDFEDLYDSETDSDEDCCDFSTSFSSQESEKRFEDSSVSSGSSGDSDVDNEGRKVRRNKTQVHRNTEDFSSSSESNSSSSTPVKLNGSISKTAPVNESCTGDVVFTELDVSPRHGRLNHSSLNYSYDPSRYTDMRQFNNSLNHFDDGSPSSIGYTDVQESPSAYTEFGHANGDVMYVGNISDFIHESFVTEKFDQSLSSPYYKLPSETPASSPRSPCSSLDGTPVPMNVSQSQSLLSSSRGCRRKDTYSGYKHMNRSLIGESPMSGYNHRQQDSPVSEYSNSQNMSNLRQTQLQRDSVVRAQKQSFSPRTNLSFSHISRSSSSLSSPGRSLSRTGHSSVSTGRLNSSVNRSFSGLNVSGLSGHSMSHSSRFNTSDHSARIAGVSNSQRRLSSSTLCADQSYTDLNISCSRPNSSVLSQNRSFNGLNDSQYGLNSSIRSSNTSFSRLNQSGCLNSSYSQSVMSTPPLDLSMSKFKKDQKESKWVGQMFSPADRVRYKNKGVSESDLCRQILDLYVSDAEESGFDITGDTSQLDLSSPGEGKEESPPGSPVLQYGKYLAPRNVVKETNVDDFTTTTVRKCYTGKARTRKLQDESQTSMLSEEGGHNTTIEELNHSRQGSVIDQEEAENRQGDQSLVEDETANSSLSQQKTHTDSLAEEESIPEDMNESMSRTRNIGPVRKGKGSQRRTALKDRTNVHLSSLELPSSLSSGIDPDSLLEEAQEEKTALLMCEKSFDRLTQLYTVHNGQRRVRCLTLNESQNVIKHYPPPKEASRVSWGQDISELDLYRHSPRRTPVKTKPILTQKENNFPYDDDTPSPIVLTKMRKPKSLSKRYKNWPWY